MRLRLLIVFLTVASLACSKRRKRTKLPPGGDDIELLFPANCSVVSDEPRQTKGEPQLSLDFTLVNDRGKFKFPTEIINEKSSGFYVSERTGKIFRLPTLAGDPQLWLDLSSKVAATESEAGLLSFAFHPKFPTTPYVFVHYNRTVGSTLQSVIARFNASALGADPGTELTILTLDQPDVNHNGGKIAFGPDDYLYIAFGDGGGAGDVNNNAQNLSNWFGTILRIDVDKGSPYEIPPDNPFVNHGTARKEIWAFGLRNPWRFSFDTQTNTMWSTDVGQFRYEEVNIINKGANYGWRLREGPECFNPPNNCPSTNLTAPVFHYSQKQGKSVIGGFVYRGGSFPKLNGTYIFSDFFSKTIWGTKFDFDKNQYVTEDFGQHNLTISTFGLGVDGEIYTLDYYSGSIYRLVAKENLVSTSSTWPEKLSDTRCFKDLGKHQFENGILSYEVNVPLWSDGAKKLRGLFLPKGEKIKVEAGLLQVPDKALLIKSFETDERRVETRFLRRNKESWEGATYIWNEDQNEAYLSIKQVSQKIGDHEWFFPGTKDCSQCHRSNQPLLGLTVKQLKHNDNSLLSKLAKREQLEGNTDEPEFPGLNDRPVSVEDRVKAYLHVNCSTCHQPENDKVTNMDLRFNADLKKLCNKEPKFFKKPGSKILIAKNPGGSLLLQRMLSTKLGERMPPLATSRVDDTASNLVREWINNLRCP